MSSGPGAAVTRLGRGADRQDGWGGLREGPAWARRGCACRRCAARSGTATMAPLLTLFSLVPAPVVLGDMRAQCPALSLRLPLVLAPLVLADQKADLLSFQCPLLVLRVPGSRGAWRGGGGGRSTKSAILAIAACGAEPGSVLVCHTAVISRKSRRLRPRCCTSRFLPGSRQPPSLRFWRSSSCLLGKES